MSTTTITTNNVTTTLPLCGFGTWKLEDGEKNTLTAIEVGYRHIDCAMIYCNEKQVGAGFKAAIDKGLVKREDLFVTSKLWNSYHKAEHVKEACQRTLKDLGLDYLDLYLMHFPVALNFVPIDDLINNKANNGKLTNELISVRETWQAMEKLVDDGLVRHIGVSNFEVQSLREMLCYAKHKPTVNQIEIHPYLSQEKMMKFCAYHKIHLTAYSPLGVLSYVPIGWGKETDSILKDPKMISIAQSVGKTIPQVLLRWGLQRGTSIIPKCSSEARMKENLSILDMNLSDGDMKAIDDLNKNLRFNPGLFAGDDSDIIHDI